jgi:hypothetical protein
VIEYVANKAGGIHFDVSRHVKSKFALLDRIRGVVLLRRTPTGMAVEIHRDNYAKPTDIFAIKPDRIDPILAEVLATCRWMAKSESLIEVRASLERRIEAAHL